MEVHRQQCQACGSREARNLLVREPNRPMVVYVRCATCRELVARYVLSEYYHHGKGIESYLRTHGASAGDSGRQWLEQFENAQREAVDGYQRCLEQLDADGKET